MVLLVVGLRLRRESAKGVVPRKILWRARLDNSFACFDELVMQTAGRLASQLTLRSSLVSRMIGFVVSGRMPTIVGVVGWMLLHVWLARRVLVPIAIVVLIIATGLWTVVILLLMVFIGVGVWRV